MAQASHLQPDKTAAETGGGFVYQGATPGPAAYNNAPTAPVSLPGSVGGGFVYNSNPNGPMTPTQPIQKQVREINKMNDHILPKAY